MSVCMASKQITSWQEIVAVVSDNNFRVNSEETVTLRVSSLLVFLFACFVCSVSLISFQLCRIRVNTEKVN